MTHARPVWQKENEYSESSYVSGTDDTFLTGASAVYGDLVAQQDHYYVIWGWQAVYIEATSQVGLHHLVLKLMDEDHTCKGLVHASNNDNTVVMLPQPSKVKTGSALYWESLDEAMGQGDTVHIDLFYSVVKSH
jgi:hypothetical protein